MNNTERLLRILKFVKAKTGDLSKNDYISILEELIPELQSKLEDARREAKLSQ